MSGRCFAYRDEITDPSLVSGLTVVKPFVSRLAALANGIAPVLIAVIIVGPLRPGHSGVSLPIPPSFASMATVLLPILMLGVPTGRIRAMAWWRNGLKTAAIAFITLRPFNFPGVRV